MSCRTIKRFLFVSGIVVFFVTLALAVNPGLVFEIDGNVFDTAGNGIDDWNTLNGDCTIPGGGSGAPRTSRTTRSRMRYAASPACLTASSSFGSCAACAGSTTRRRRTRPLHGAR